MTGYENQTVTAVSVSADVTFTQNFALARSAHTLTVNSDPISSVDFTVDGGAQTTPYSGSLVEGDYEVVMLSTWTDGVDVYNFYRWEDASTNPSRTISLTANITVTAYYTLLPVPEYPAVYVDPISTINETLTPGMVGPIDNVAGKLNKTGAFFTLAGPVASGPGTLATVTFEVVGIGKSNITLGSATQLSGWNATEGKRYFIVDGKNEPDHLGHGYFNNRPTGPYHEVSIQRIIAPDNTVGGGNVSIDVRVGNGGTFTENVNVTVSYNNTLLDSVIIEMEKETSQTIEFIWDTRDIFANIEANKTYIIKAEATIVPVDKYPPNNNRTKQITLRERHDVSIKDNVKISPNPAFVGDDINITVTVENQGSYDENVTIITIVGKGVEEINKTILMVEAGKNKTFSFTWTTTGLDPDTYDMTVDAHIPEDDPDPPPGDDVELQSILLTLGHDVAVTSIVITITPIYVGDDASINVYVANNGPYNETCTVKVFYGTTLIESKTTNLTQGEVKFTSFTWNTSGFAPGSYNIRAEVILEGYEDVDPSNNIKTYASPIVVKLPPGTITGTVTDSSSGEVIANATVTVNGMSATSNSSGAYVISGVPPGNYTVTASADGYEISSETITLTAGETEILNFTLKPVQPLNILLYVGVAAILVIVAAIAVYNFRIRKPKPT